MIKFEKSKIKIKVIKWKKLSLRNKILFFFAILVYSTTITIFTLQVFPQHTGIEILLSTLFFTFCLQYIFLGKIWTKAGIETGLAALIFFVLYLIAIIIINFRIIKDILIG